ncbi:hypothetical protein [Halocella sp. SP3-1]|uniref:hypothetical protein n=1 Tax=Halocella sp. SP3-1 TaxID=2382161 RepID=UPI000F7D8048|nr:hypothetical protein [Halocella sp. SP3-1]
MGDNKQLLTHKELLTFSNLTNLEWEFADIKITSNNNDKGDVVRGEGEEYKKLNNLLTPKVFYKEDDDGEREYRYGANDEGELEDEEQGFAQLRRNAGIAMEYLEKIGTDNKEGDFLKDWEVIYGGDNYQVVADYINNKWSRLCQFLNSIDETLNLDEREKIDPGRESIEDLFVISVSDNLEVIDCNNYLTFNGAFV